jgi:tRNA dimethylallyltransferase
VTNKRPVIFVVGTTASGKSDWAMKWCKKFGGVIVNCDSVQVYQKLDIGSAKPSKQEQAEVPHYLVDHVAPPNEITAGVYSRDFFECLEKIPGKGPVFVVGGTGFYFLAIEKGMYPVKKISQELKDQVEAEVKAPGGAEKLYAELQAMDPEYAAKIHLADHYRLGRAIELIRLEGKGVTQIKKEFESQQNPFPYPLLKVGPSWDRDVLRTRIELRTRTMLEKGLIKEVQGLLDEGLKDWPPMSSVGYRETVDMIEGRLPEADLFQLIVTNTYQLAKRQRTWFQRDADIQWFPGDTGFADASAVVEEFLRTRAED